MNHETLIIFLLGLLLCVASSNAKSNPSMQHGHVGGMVHPPKCNGLVGDCISPDEEMMMESDISKRILAEGSKYISYEVLKKNRVPCKERGSSYYNCYAHKRVNPYKRGCTAITRCKRSMSY